MASSRALLVALAVLVARALPAAARAQEGDAREVQAQRLEHMLGYLDADYARFGRREHGEHLALVTETERAARGLTAPPDIEARVAGVGALVSRFAADAEIHARVAELRVALVGAYRIEQAPQALPDASHGRALYEAHCAACHGVTGRADTPAAAALRPRPASFVDPLFGETLSPYDITTAIRFGVDGTAMVPVRVLGDADRWDIAFYVLGLRHPGRLEDHAPAFTVSELALVTDQELRAELFAAGIGGASLDPTLAALRRRAPFEPQPGGGSLAVARTRLDEVRVAVDRGERAAAIGALVDAPQPAEVDPAALAWLRSAFARVGDRVRSDATPMEVRAAIADALRALTHAEHVLGEHDRATGQRTFVSWPGWGALFAALAMAALFGALRLARRADHARLSRALRVLTAMFGALAVAALARGIRRERSRWPDEGPTSASTATTATGAAVATAAADARAEPPCSEPGFGPGPALHATEGLLAFDVTHDCLFPENARLEIALNLRERARPGRAQVDALLRDLFRQARAAVGTRMPDLTHICVFAAGTVEWKDPYGCLEFEADEGPEGELSVRLDLPFEPEEWAKAFAASHTEGFAGSLRPRVTVDGARRELTIVYPYVEKSTGRWAARLTVPEAAIPFFPLAYDFYPPRTDLQAFVFVGTWRGKPVLTVHVADLNAFLSMDPWPIRERMAQARIPLDPDAERAPDQRAILGREYTEALAKLPHGSVVIDRTLLAD